MVFRPFGSAQDRRVVDGDRAEDAFVFAIHVDGVDQPGQDGATGGQVVGLQGGLDALDAFAELVKAHLGGNGVLTGVVFGQAGTVRGFIGFELAETIAIKY